jgi:uncharacterized oxidoreductase
MPGGGTTRTRGSRTVSSSVMKIQHDKLKRLVAAIFAAAGCRPPEDERVARYLVESNLVGHDSHGVIRVKPYIEWLRDGKVVANQTITVAFQNECLAVVDGGFGFGQSIGEQALQLGIDKASRHGVAVVAVRNCGHLGRIGDWAEMAARAGLVSLHFVNTSGAGLLVAPFGGISRRLSANPIAAGVPIQGRPPIILDISTSAIAEGKIKVAFNKQARLPAGCIIDPQGLPSDDPVMFYGTPPGAILPFGGHKGYGLGILAELLAGALTGGGCSKPGVAQLSNGMLSILMQPTFFATQEDLAEEMSGFVEFVKSSEKVSPDAQILMPGEVEQRNREQRMANGIELDETTWKQIVETGKSVGVTEEQVEKLTE